MKIFKRSKFLFAAIAVILTLAMPTSAFAANYTVVKGDSLYTISKMFNTNVSTIMSRNGLTGSMIYPGQVLDVPSSTYTVKSGDSLYIIAKKFGISLDSLRKMNNKWDNMIYPGQKLVVPAGSGTQTQTPAQPSGKILSKSGVYYTQADVELLARLVTAEAQSEPFNAQVGVAAVVLNRVKDSYFPNNIYDVVYQKIDKYYQFTPVENGWINRPATQQARNAVYEALNGSDPSKGALFYFDDSATNKWLWSKPILAYIGHMVFVK